MAANTLSVLPISHSCREANVSQSPHTSNLKPVNLVSSAIESNLSTRSIHPWHRCSTYHESTVATVLYSLPTAKLEGASSEKLPKWSLRAIKAFSLAQMVAMQIKCTQTWSHCLLMGILLEGTSLAANFLRENGITYYKVQEATFNVFGKPEEDLIAPDHPPITDQTQRIFDWAVDQQLKSGESGEITTTHLLLGIWSEKDSAGHKIMATLGFDDEKAKELAKYMNKDILRSFK